MNPINSIKLDNSTNFISKKESKIEVISIDGLKDLDAEILKNRRVVAAEKKKEVILVVAALIFLSLVGIAATFCALFVNPLLFPAIIITGLFITIPLLIPCASKRSDAILKYSHRAADLEACKEELQQKDGKFKELLLAKNPDKKEFKIEDLIKIHKLYQITKTVNDAHHKAEQNKLKAEEELRKCLAEIRVS